jgi:RNA polymerase sigma factor (sigma-70 family)
MHPPLAQEAATPPESLIVDALLERHLESLRGFIDRHTGRLLRCRESRSDLVQSVCREVLERADRFRHRGEARFRNWLYATAARKIKNRIRYFRAERRNGEREVRLAEALRSTWDRNLPPPRQRLRTPSQDAVMQENLEKLQRALMRLTVDQRNAILWSRFAGVSGAELARLLGRSEGATRTLLSRALAMLADHLGENDPSKE